MCYRIFRLIKRLKRILRYIFTDFLSVNAVYKFKNNMNRTAKKLDMNNSSFKNSSGASKKSFSTAYDLYMLGKAAISYSDIVDMWMCRIRTVKIEGKMKRDLTVENTVLKQGSQIMREYLIGGKSGSWDGIHKSHIFMCLIKNETYIITVMAGDRASFENIYKIGLELCKYAEGEPMGDYCAQMTKLGGGFVIYNITKKKTLFCCNEHSEMVPASTTKVLTAICVLNSKIDLNKKITVNSLDITDGSGSIFYEGDTVTVLDALYIMMLESSNTMARTLARTVGYLL